MLKSAIPYLVYIFVMPLLLTLTFKCASYTKSNRNGTIFYHFSNYSYLILFVAYIFFICFFVFIKIGENSLGGNDSFVYLSRFNEANIPLFTSLRIQNNELGYGLIIWLIRKFTSNYRIVLLIFYTIIFCTEIYFLKHFYWDKYTAISYTLLALMTLSGICILRISLSIHIALIVYIKIKGSEYKKAVFWSLVALSIHVSAIILFPIIILCHVFKNDILSHKLAIPFYSIAILFTIIIVNLSIIFISGTKYSLYIGTGGFATASYLFYYTIIFSLLIRLEKFRKNNTDTITYWTVLTSVIFACIAQLKYGIIYRMLLFYEPISMILTANLMREFSILKRKNNINYGNFINVILFAFIIIRLVGFFTGSVYSYGLYPYINILISK